VSLSPGTNSHERIGIAHPFLSQPYSQATPPR